MKKFWLCAILVLFGGAIPARAAVETSFWQTVKSEHFVIYYEEAPAGFINQAVNTAENYYNNIVKNFGYDRIEFWNGENRVKIFFYKNSLAYQTMLQRSGQPSGKVNVKSMIFKTYIGQDEFLDSILARELARIIFKEFIGQKISLPLWIEEGAARSQEESGLLESFLEKAKVMAGGGLYAGIDKLSEIKESNLIEPDYFYAQSVSLIVFLLKEYGQDKFLNFSRALRGQDKWQEALIDTYRFTDLNDAESKWREFALK